jgi:uncharacterized Zn finger protein
MSCPWCSEELKIVKEISSNNKVIIHKCQHCGNIVGAYLKEMEEYLVNFFNRYAFTFTPKPSIMKVE